MGITEKNSQCLASLDFLRGWMATFVLLSHTVLVTNSLGELRFFYGLAAFGVDTFMFISGFLMMWHFCSRREIEPWEKPKTWAAFYIRRFFRIAPLYYCALTLAYVFQDPLMAMTAENHASLPSAFVSGVHDPTDSTLSIANVFSHYSFAFGLIPKFASNNCLPDWSIGLEMQFYVAFPFIALLLERTQFWKGALALIAVHWTSLKLFGVGIDASPKALGLFPMATFLPLKLNCFLSGILIAEAFYEKKSVSKQVFLLLVGLAVAAMYMKKFFLLCFVFCIYEYSMVRGTGFASLDRVITWVSRIVKLRVFHWMADVSYGVYLLHTLILAPVVWLLLKYPSYGHLAPVVRFVICLTIASPLVFLAAFLFHRIVEVPGIDLGKSLIARVRYRNKAPSMLSRKGEANPMDVEPVTLLRNKSDEPPA